MKRSFYKKTGAFLLALILSVSMLQIFPAGVRAADFALEDETVVMADEFEAEEEFAVKDAAVYPPITIILHGGEYGYFGDPSVKEKESIQYPGEFFIDDTVPDCDDDTLFFTGWTTDPEGTEATVISRETAVNSAGTDLYPVWTNEAYVVYHAQEGYFDIDGMEYGQVNMLYPLGEHFKDITPKTHSDQLVFAGWYSGYNGAGTRYTDETVIDRLNLDAYAYWKPDMDRIAEVETDTVYPIELERGSVMYRFTPDETTVYEISSSDAETDYVQAYIRLMDENRKVIEDADALGDGNVALSRELEAGKTYLLSLSEFSGHSIFFNFKIQRADYATVTFHTGLEPGEAWFDEDPSKDEKQIRIQIGKDIHNYKSSGLVIKEAQKYSLLGWSVTPGTHETEDHLYVEEDMDVYAVFDQFDTVLLDANGGYFTIPERMETQLINYRPGTVFGEVFEPHIDDPDLAFSGWAATPDASEPEIVEGITYFDDLPDVIYAVYGEKEEVIFDANSDYGGYMVNNPNITIYRSSQGKGHIFYGMALMNGDPKMTPLYWRDHKGYEFPYMEDNPYYEITEDTTFTAVWGRKIVVDANGGYFGELPEDPDDAPVSALTITFKAEEHFDQDWIDGLVGLPNHTDSNKYLAGWALSPDAEEPDVVNGETSVMELTRVYAVWKDSVIPASAIELNKTSAEIAATKTLQLKAKLTPAESTSAVIWESTDNKIAEVDENGLVTAKKYGKTKIIATAGDLKAVCDVQVLFKDVANHGKSYFDPVYWAVREGITKVSVEFRPDDAVTRGEFTAFLYRLADRPDVSKITDRFTDVEKNTKFAKEITWAVNEGIINGYSNGTFKPTASITRAQVAIMLWRYAGRPAVNVKKSPFPDVELNSSDTSKAIIWGVKNGIIKGSGGKFLPKETCTRGQTVTFLYRYTTK